MMMTRRKTVRSGSVLAESALIYPVMFLLILGVILLGLAVFRYQQVSHISREASRWASVHGQQWATENKTTAATPADIYNKAILPHAAGMQKAGITYSVTWNTRADGTPDKRPTRVVLVVDPVTGLSKEVAQYNTVSVTVTYSWKAPLFGNLPVSCTSVNTIYY
jgi:Flp pilus assembly protein TadG